MRNRSEDSGVAFVQRARVLSGPDWGMRSMPCNKIFIIVFIVEIVKLKECLDQSKTAGNSLINTYVLFSCR